jgi:hypothetical protein
MTLKEALRFRFANGTQVGEASADQWAAELARYRQELSALEAQNVEAMSEVERRRTRARLLRMRELSRAVKVVLSTGTEVSRIVGLQFSLVGGFSRWVISPCRDRRVSFLAVGRGVSAPAAV